MKQWINYIKTPQRAFAFLFLLLFPLHTVFIYSERFVNGYKWEYGTLSYYGIELLGWILLISVVVPLIRRTKQITFRVSPDRIFVSALLFCLLYSFVAAFWAIDSNLAQQQTTLVILMCLMAIVLPTVLARREIVGAITAGAILPLGIGIYQFFAQDLFSSVWLGMSGPDVADGGVSVVQFGEERWVRAYGAFAHPNVFGGYLVLVAMGILLRLQEKTREWVQAGYMGVLVLIGTVLVFTMSRSAWIALGIGAFVLLTYTLRRLHKSTRVQVQKGMIALGLGVIVGVCIAWPLVSSRVFGGGAHEYASVSERMVLQDIAMELFAQHPILGVGPGNMTAALIAYDGSQAGYVYQPVHSVPLLLLVEYGIVGVLLLLLVGSTAVRYIKKKPQTQFFLVFGVVLLPPLLFDHYLWTSVHGLGIVAVFLAILISPNVASSLDSSTKSIDE